MAANGGSKSESDEEEPVSFSKTDNPLEDPIITRLEMQARLRKKDVTSCVNKISETVRIILRAANGGSSGGNNLVVSGYITAGAGLIEK